MLNRCLLNEKLFLKILIGLGEKPIELRLDNKKLRKPRRSVKEISQESRQS